MRAKSGDTLIEDVDEFFEFVDKNHLNKYNGFNELTPVARLTGITSPVKMLVEYNSILECKTIESKLKEMCIVFTPKAYDDGGGNIRASNHLKKELKKLKRQYSCSVSFESVIWDLIIEHYDNL